MRIACVHALPLEYYPPARNALAVLARHPGWEVRVWTAENRRALPRWNHAGVAVERLNYPGTQTPVPLRIAGYLRWHFRTAAALAAWHPAAVVSVEPHSALAAWLYYRLFNGTAELFIHHHEYYAPEDYRARGMRLLRRTHPLERDYLFSRARWVSQTNRERLRLLREWNPKINETAAHVMPNYPPREWIAGAAALNRARDAANGARSNLLRLVYIGSASFDDTFIREIAEWTAGNPNLATLHVLSDNMHVDLRDWLTALGAANVTLNAKHTPYEQLPLVLHAFDVGLVLYRGNTLNFVHNVPNKAIEYLACGLEVWYPPAMTGMREFHRSHQAEQLTEVDFAAAADIARAAGIAVSVRSQARKVRTADEFPFTCEEAMAPLVAEMEALDARGR
ncbi:MAG TPA: hypothetical protein VM939_11700 [Gemmatimonadaceae bacterium]|nr:hypothetical protein [Gemmatimonadaceae bacterium]